MNYFDQSAANWDSEPRRIELMKAIGKAILRDAKPTKAMDVLDYGCGTGLVGLFLLPHVRSATGADSSAGMLDVLRTKIREGGINGMTTIQLDLERQPVPLERFHVIVSCMVLHHVADLEQVLSAFYKMLLPGGVLCVADLDRARRLSFGGSRSQRASPRIRPSHAPGPIENGWIRRYHDFNCLHNSEAGRRRRHPKLFGVLDGGTTVILPCFK